MNSVSASTEISEPETVPNNHVFVTGDMRALVSISLYTTLFIALLVTTEASRLSVPKVLLPFFPGVEVPFTIEAGGGCYTWYTHHPEIISVTPIFENSTLCSQKAILSSKAEQPKRVTTVVIAEEIVTGQVLRCDVIVDLIVTLEIESRTRELYVDDAPVELTVVGLDKEGNTFSSLAGINFQWTVMMDESAGILEPSTKIRILRYTEALYYIPEYIALMEKAGKQGDIALVSGISTGYSAVKVRIEAEVYKNIPVTSIRLLVLEKIFVTPCCEVLLLLHARVHFQVKRLVERKVTEMDPPLISYMVQLENQVVFPGGDPDLPVADLDETSLVVTAVQLGCTSLIFAHKNILMPGGSSLPNCTVCVVEPGYLGFSIRPGELWILEVEKSYEVSIEVYEKISSRRVYPSQNLRISVQFPPQFFSVILSSENGSYHVVRALHTGTTSINASLTGVDPQDSPFWMFLNQIFQEQEVKIFLPITLSPQTVAFPAYPRDASYRYLVKVAGGSGNVSWLSTNESIASVTTRGVVITRRDPGHCMVQASDIMNPLHSAESHVLVLSVTSLELLPSNADTQVGREIHIPLVVYGNYQGASIPFINCSLLPLHISMDRGGVFSIQEDRCRFAPPSCSCLKILAQNLGHVVLTVSVTTADGEYHNNTIFSAYNPLKAVDPVHTSVLSLYSTKVMVFEGGPRPWLPEPSSFFMWLTAQDWSGVHIQQIGDPAKAKQKLHTYQVQCTKLGEQVLTFQLGNHPGILNPRPSVDMVEVMLICAVPAHMSLYPVYPVPNGAQPCPIPKHNPELMPVSMLRDTKLELILYDQYKRKFDNFSSLAMDWTSSNETMALLSYSQGMQEIPKSDATGQTWLHGQHLLEVKNIKGTVLISVTCAGYKSWVQVQDTSLLIITTLKLSLVDEVSILPNYITVFDHPKVEETLNLVEGSGYFLVNISDPRMVTTTYEEAENTVQVIPLHPGTLTLEVQDLCILSASYATATIHVSDIYELEISLVDKVEVGKSVEVLVKVWDFSHRPFLNRHFNIMQLNVQSSSPIVILKKLPENDKFSWSYLLHGTGVGETTLVVTAHDKARRTITSAPHPVEVFAPFRLVPDKITLIPHNMIQVTSEGGPQPQSVIQFSVSNDSVATINEVGQVTGLAVGTTKIRGTVQAMSEEMGSSMVSTQDEIVVEVIHLKAIRIHIPVTRLIIPSEMPVYVMGISSTQTPFSFSNSKPPLQFYWSLNKRDVVTLEPRMTEASVELQPELNFAQLVRTWAIGRVSIKVTVRSVSGGQFEGNTAELVDQVQVVVLRGLSLLTPKCPIQQILMAPNSYLTVTTNKDGGASVISYILQSFPNASVIEDDGHGHLRAGGITGSSILKISAVEPFGITQNLVIGVQVAPVNYLRIEVNPKLHTRSGHPLASFPVGITLELNVHFYSSIGEKFHTQKTQLRFATNRDDLLLIEPGIRNYTFLVTTVMQGETLLRVWDEAHPGMADFMPIPVEDAISPELKMPIAVGEVICLSTELVNSNDEPGVWQTSPGPFLQVDGVTGVAVARSKGITNVFYIITGMFTTHKQVTIESSESLIMRLTSQSHVTNFPSTRQYTAFVSFSRTEPVIKGPCSKVQIEVAQEMLTSANLLICSVQFSNQSIHIPATKVFQIRPDFSVETGHYTCEISLRTLTHMEMQALSTADTLVELRASLLGGVGLLHVPFHPAFHVNQTELLFSRHELDSHIRIYGTSIVLRNVEIASSFPDLLFGIDIISAKQAGLFLISVSALDFESIRLSPVPLFINISCALTGQDMALPVKAVLEDQEAERRPLSIPAISIYVILLTAFAVTAITCVTLIASISLTNLQKMKFLLTMSLFPVYNAFIDRLQTTPIIYMSTSNGLSPIRSPQDTRSSPVRRRSNYHGRLWSSGH
ncbi:nuclear pore membrane glycoprotein 210-like [Bufo bufo]|uniref:nuclear pore membrane glycoprotein 210-like n=1 Tax=Bufo bufo TaxID=8384 RepID=UPI001ABE6835|nr:nuclear pore membrane glycoprotein 210-like [Bufo bufo]